MNRENLVRLLTQAFERTAERLRAQSFDDPRPDNLRAQDVVSLLRERSREVTDRMVAEDEEG